MLLGPHSMWAIISDEPTGQASSSEILELDTSTDLEVNELADLDEEDDERDHVTSIPPFSDKEKQEHRKMIISASVTNAMWFDAAYA